jgi:hypothetical protein
MLPGPQAEICLGCHENRAASQRKVAEGRLAPEARPASLGSVLDQPFLHPVDDSPHRGARGMDLETHAGGTRKGSTLDPSMPEFELCDGCHQETSARVEDPRDVGGLLDPVNRSFHPVKAQSAERSPSLLPEFVGREINCTDCHGNSDPGGARGIHGSAVRFLLRDEYTTLDGSTESAAAYALCYRCHDREAVLDSTLFPEHDLHVVQQRVACSTCHNPHGAVDSRALMRFEERPGVPAVSPSLTTGLLAFDSGAPGGGSCHMTCHGHDHGPSHYGTAALPAGPRDPPTVDADISPETTKKRQGRRRKK